MDARQLQYFLAVVDLGTVRRAAEALFVAQPSVSQSLGALERDLGALLFHRTGRRLVLTPAGEQLVDPARDVLSGLDLARATVEATDGLRHGRLVLAAMPSQSVSPLSELIRRYHRDHERVTVSVRAADTPSDVQAQLRSAVVELGLLAVTGDVPDYDGLTVHQLEVQRFIAVAAPGGVPSGVDPVGAADLAGAALIVGQPGTGMRRVADGILAASVGSRIAVEIEHREAVLPLVLAGVGVAVLSESWRELARSTGADVRDLDTDDRLQVCLAHRTRRLSPAAAAFLRTSLGPTWSPDHP